VESGLGYVLGRLFEQAGLVIGGLYYLVSGRRVPFWRAVFRWWVLRLAPLGAAGRAAKNLPAWRSR
jgi:hypothetical protein